MADFNWEIFPVKDGETADPAAGASPAAVTVTAGKRWLFLGATVYCDTSADAANRLATMNIKTDGTNLKAVIQKPEVDPTTVYSNNIREIEEVLGLEAARNAVIKEAKAVLDGQGLNVNPRHVMLVADVMCYEGEVKAIGRQGVSGSKASVFARAAFEETVKHLHNASIKGHADNLSGITENIIIGQTIPVECRTH